MSALPLATRVKRQRPVMTALPSKSSTKAAGLSLNAAPSPQPVLDINGDCAQSPGVRAQQIVTIPKTARLLNLLFIFFLWGLPRLPMAFFSSLQSAAVRSGDTFPRMAAVGNGLCFNSSLTLLQQIHRSKQASYGLA